MSIAELDAELDSPLSGSVSRPTISVPTKFDVGLNGRGYMLDLAMDVDGFRGTRFSRKSVSVLRDQSDVGETPGENSLNRQDFWRRTQESWHHGSGQANLDRSNSDSARFHTSKGVDVWTQWQLSLLNDTTKVLTSANTNLRLTACGTTLYLSDGNSLKFTADIAAGPAVFTTVTGTPASACAWVTTDGYNVYAAYGTDVWHTTRGAAAATSFATGFGTINCLGYVKGRLMVAAANSIFNVTTSGAAPTALLAHANSDFAWVGFAEGPGFIYAAGYSGTRSLIYKITIQPDGTSLTTPSVAGELPTGETVQSVKGYSGLLLVGTSLGVRVATISASGDLTFGPLIPTTSAVLNFEPQDRFVWYGLTNYDSTSTGLGRLDLSVFTDPLAPARASDLMATTQGAVLSISSYGTRRVFTVSGQGVYLESTSKVASGSLSTGKIAFGIGDDKVAMYLDLRTQPLLGTVGTAISAGGSTAIALDTFNATGATKPDSPINVQQQRAEFFELTLTLNRDGTPTLGPTVNRYTLRAYPAPNRSQQIVVPVLLHGRVQDRLGSEFAMNVLAERRAIDALLRSQALVSYQEGQESFVVRVDDVTWIPVKPSSDSKTFDGTLVMYLREVPA